MKYIDADKLIKLVKEWRSKQVGFSWDAVNEVLKIIDSLQQEQPEVDLEKELIQWHKRHFKKTGTYEKYSGFYLKNSSQLDLARHFYELGQQNRSKISDNSLKELRKEVIKFNQDHFDELHSDMDTIDIVHIVARHFYELGLKARK